MLLFRLIKLGEGRRVGWLVGWLVRWLVGQTYVRTAGEGRRRDGFQNDSQGAKEKERKRLKPGENWRTRDPAGERHRIAQPSRRDNRNDFVL